MLEYTAFNRANFKSKDTDTYVSEETERHSPTQFESKKQEKKKGGATGGKVFYSSVPKIDYGSKKFLH